MREILLFFGNKCTLLLTRPHRNDGLYDFVLFVLYSKQEIPKRAVQHRKFWCFNVPVVYINLLFLLLFGTLWRTLGTRTPDQKFARIPGFRT